MKSFVEEEWLDAVAGKDFFYPAAYLDIPEFVILLAPTVSRFICNDINYTTSTDCISPVPRMFRLLNEAAPDSALRNTRLKDVRTAGIPYRDLKPSTLAQGFSDGSNEIAVLRRKGFGQYALLERQERSIGVFVHRNDSAYEGGSNVWFLANRHKEHEPLANLWSKLSIRLADQALIISDGSLTDFKFLRPDTSVSGSDDYLNRKNEGHISFQGFTWTCVGFMPGRGHSLIWGLRRN